MTDSHFDFSAAFSDANLPAEDEIAPHQCPECSEIRHDFGGARANEISDEVLARRADSLPLLTPKAWRYYLPAYLDYAARNIDSDLGRYLLINLDMEANATHGFEPQISALSVTEKRTVLAFLDTYGGYDDEDFDEPMILRIKRKLSDA